MFALLSPRMLAALVIAAVLSFTHFFAYRTGKNTVRVQWDKAALEQTQALVDAEKASRAREQALQTKLNEAVNAANKRTQIAKADAAAASRVAGSLRDDLATARRNLSSAAADAVRQYASTLSDVFGECTAEVERLASEAQSHAIDSLTLQQAWPK
jgi:hypothetical protein